MALVTSPIVTRCRSANCSIPVPDRRFGLLQYPIQFVQQLKIEATEEPGQYAVGADGFLNDLAVELF